MGEADRDERLRRLEERIERFKAERAPAPSTSEEHYSQASQGWRMVIELVTGLMIGFGIGYGLDVLFGTLPVFLVLFALLGFAAGVRTMMRTAEEIRRDQEAGRPAGKED
ncbi:ATP synthase protein I [Meinhardsimonia xiamenensis]|jgi:ATP synthase protein I|uniref:ATP synthase protein I n=1 Tax=Meinhardsimonia xiamenensis TaxID=990712 RepID=A0A1G8YJM5_9RHOB|nr:AtpZ/AtpI family protein [Meinhardsimonia xiamenensis]PRX37332.1 ATP synthase protein I [Meinhardsimonia xiamenensis]SDK03079.1 ATP synthase protein I [Meinhardsimonia xiamenensis]